MKISSIPLLEIGEEESTAEIAGPQSRCSTRKVDVDGLQKSCQNDIGLVPRHSQSATILPGPL